MIDEHPRIRALGVLGGIVTAVLGLTSPLLAQCEVDRPGVGDARGTVFVDADGNGRRDPDERGVDDVKVSNGCSVTQTDDQGRYRIDLAPTEILFITKPAAYSVPLDEYNIPQFFYRHYPNGTPSVVDGASVEWQFPVIERTGPIPASIDFPLLVHPEASLEFKAHGFADPQARTDLSEDMLREDSINPLIGNPYGVLFGLTVGETASMRRPKTPTAPRRSRRIFGNPCYLTP